MSGRALTAFRLVVCRGRCSVNRVLAYYALLSLICMHASAHRLEELFPRSLIAYGGLAVSLVYANAR